MTTEYPAAPTGVPQPYEAPSLPAQQTGYGPYPPPQQQQNPWGAAAPNGYPIVVAQAPAKSNGLGVAGFVTGLLGLIFCWVPVLGLILALLGVILGAAGINSGKKQGSGTGLAIAGLVLGIVAVIPAIIVIAALSSV